MPRRPATLMRRSRPWRTSSRLPTNYRSGRGDVMGLLPRHPDPTPCPERDRVHELIGAHTTASRQIAAQLDRAVIAGAVDEAAGYARELSRVLDSLTALHAVVAAAGAADTQTGRTPGCEYRVTALFLA